MKSRLIAALTAALIVTGCSGIEPAEDMAQARYGKVVSTMVVSGEGVGRMRVLVRLGDGSMLEVVQERDSAILVGDVVRVLGTGNDVRVRRL